MYAIVKDKRDPLNGSLLQIIGYTHLHFECEIVSPSSDLWTRGDVDLFRPNRIKILDSESDVETINRLLNSYNTKKL